jgi:hypothetical protein
MNVWVQAREMYEKAGLSLDDDYRYCQLYGYIFQGPSFLLMGEEVHDGWFVKFAIGKNSIPLFLRLMPFEKEYIYFCRVHLGKTEPIKIPLSKFKKLYERNQ